VRRAARWCVPLLVMLTALAIGTTLYAWVITAALG
jgi:hypothetical protein